MRQLNVHKLVRDLNKLCNDLCDRYDINYGGCCYVAYEIAKHLDRFHISYELRVINDYAINQLELAKGIKSISGRNTCYHYYLVIHGGGSVNKGNFCSWYYDYVITEISHRDLNTIYRTGRWNSVYKKKNNKLIKKIISLHFKQYGKTNKTNLHFYKSSSMSKM